ncbi:MAG: S8 family serine peptidase, partial [Geminicoccaceae bacterium]|nr:S8 family serine peptidase [Geminicoccaceae bacterium]
MIRIGLVDSGVEEEQEGHVVAARSFTGRPLAPDPSGHGSRVAKIILGHHPDAVLFNAQAFGVGPGSSEAVAQAIRWLILEQARLVNLSLGLRHDRPVLRDAAAEA